MLPHLWTSLDTLDPIKDRQNRAICEERAKAATSSVCTTFAPLVHQSGFPSRRAWISGRACLGSAQRSGNPSRLGELLSCERRELSQGRAAARPASTSGRDRFGSSGSSTRRAPTPAIPFLPGWQSQRDQLRAHLGHRCDSLLFVFVAAQVPVLQRRSVCLAVHASCRHSTISVLLFGTRHSFTTSRSFDQQAWWPTLEKPSRRPARPIRTRECDSDSWGRTDQLLMT